MRHDAARMAMRCVVGGGFAGGDGEVAAGGLARGGRPLKVLFPVVRRNTPHYVHYFSKSRSDGRVCDDPDENIMNSECFDILVTCWIKLGSSILTLRF